MIEGSNDQARARATDRYGAAVDNNEILLNRYCNKSKETNVYIKP